MKRAPFEGGDSGEHARLSLTELKARLAENASRIDAMMDSMSEEELNTTAQMDSCCVAQNGGVGGLQVHSCEHCCALRDIQNEDSKVEKVGDVNFNRTKK